VPDPADGDLERRVRRLEDEVVQLKDGLSVSRADATAARVLAGGVDRDMSEIRTEMRAHRQSLNALRETQVEFSQQLRSLDAKLDSNTGSLQSQIDSLRSEMQQGFGMVHTGMAQIVAMLRDPEQRGEG
jgi:chromosome segregation ATPase